MNVVKCSEAFFHSKHYIKVKKATFTIIDGSAIFNAPVSHDSVPTSDLQCLN